MDQLTFEGKITDLYAEDYQYLQDSVNAEILKVIKSMIEGKLTSSVIKGFYLQIDLGDTTKLKITHGGECDDYGSVISTNGILIESNNELEQIDLSDYTAGTINKVFVKCEQVYASYDRTTQEIVEEERKAIDLYDYSLVYNRLVDKMSVVVYTQAEYDVLTQDEKDLLVLLGQTEAQGAGIPLVSVDTTVVTYFKLNIPDHLIDLDNLAYDFMLPQRMVYPTSTGDIDDQYYGTPDDLIDDLNKVRTQIRNIKATTHWDDYHAGVSGNDSDMNELHRSGIFPNAHNTYNLTITSGGYAVVIDTGKALINRDIKEDAHDTTTVSVTPGDSFSISGEVHTIPWQPFPQPYTFYLDYAPATDLVIIDSDSSILVEGLDYTFVSSTGKITTIVGGDMVNEDVTCNYNAGGYRCDLIALGITGIVYLEGAISLTKNPMPPLLTSAGLVPLYYLYREPQKDYIEDYQIVDGRFYTFPVKEVRELGYEDLTSYYEGTFEQLNTGATHKMTFFSSSSGLSVDQGDYWDVVATPAGPGISMSSDTYMLTYLYTKPNDQFWVLSEPTHEGAIRIGTTTETLTIKLEYETVPGSGVLDGIVEKTISPKVYSTSTGILPILVTSTGFDEGVTKIKLSITSGSALTFWKILIGRTDLEYIENFIDFVWNQLNELYVNTAGYRKHLEYLDTQNESLRKRLSKTEILNLEQELRINFLLGRNSTNSNLFSDMFIDVSKTDETLFETATSPSEIMDDTVFNNNWKNTSKVSDIDFKNGFIRQRKQPYMFELLNEYSLSEIGKTNKSGIVYDSTNSCYWMISNSGLNDLGEITKLGKHLTKNRVEVQGQWFLPAVASSAWMGITVDPINSKLYFSLWNVGGSKIYGIDINDDKSLGVTASKIYSGSTIVPGTSTFADYTDTTANSAISDLVLYDADNIGYLLGTVTGASEWSLKFRELDLTASVLSPITQFNGIIPGIGNTNGRSIEKYEDFLYFKINDTSTNERILFRINIETDIIADKLVRHSGRCLLARDVARKSIYANEGITVSPNGDIIEICSPPAITYGGISRSQDILYRRALEEALWAENQVAGGDFMSAVSAVFPTSPRACMVDGNGWMYTADTGVSAGAAYIYRYKPDLSTAHIRSRVIGTSNCIGVFDMATDGTNVFMILRDATNYSIYKGTLSALTTALDAGTSITIPDATWTLVSGSDTTDAKVGICYDEDNEIFYVVNNTIKCIDTVSTSGTYTTPVYTLLAGKDYSGIACKNENIYVNETTTATLRGKIYVLPATKQSLIKWFAGHIHQDPVWTLSISGLRAMDFNGVDLVTTHQAYLSFLTMKVLENPDVLQLHSFIDYNNILLSNNVSASTAISERYFEPHQFSDTRDCPHKFYMAVGYNDEGFSLLNLDEFLFEQTTSGNDRYTVSNIVVKHFKCATNNVISSATAYCTALEIEKDMIFFGGASQGLYMIDLKSGRSLRLTTGSASGTRYSGTLSQRNDGLGYTSGSYSPELRIGSTSVYKLSARTFFNDDVSEYNYVNPRTYIALAGGVAVDLIRIDWGTTGDKTLVVAYQSILYPLTGVVSAVFIAPSGQVFAGQYATSSTLYKLKTGYAWNVTSSYHGGVTTGITIPAYMMHIAKNSICWKSSAGIWRHELYVSSADKTTLVMTGSFQIIDIENATQEIIYDSRTYSAPLSNYLDSCDVFEDLVAIPVANESITYDVGLILAKKLHFNDIRPLSVYNYGSGSNGVVSASGSKGFSEGWTPIYIENILNNNTFPHFYRYTTFYNASRSCNFSSDTFKILCCATDLGLQLFHFPYSNNCTHKSIEITIDNPEAYVYRQHILSGYGDE